MTTTHHILDFWTQRLTQVSDKNMVWHSRDEGGHFEGAGICFTDLYCGVWVDHQKRMCWEVRRPPEHILNLTPDGAKFDGAECDYDEMTAVLKQLHAAIGKQQESVFLSQIPLYCDKGQSLIRNFKNGDIPPPENLARIYHYLTLGLKNHKNLMTEDQMDVAKDVLVGIQPVFRHLERLYPGLHPGG